MLSFQFPNPQLVNSITGWRLDSHGFFQCIYPNHDCWIMQCVSEHHFSWYNQTRAGAREYPSRYPKSLNNLEGVDCLISVLYEPIAIPHMFYDAGITGSRRLLSTRRSPLCVNHRQQIHFPTAPVRYDKSPDRGCIDQSWPLDQGTERGRGGGVIVYWWEGVSQRLVQGPRCVNGA